MSGNAIHFGTSGWRGIIAEMVNDAARLCRMTSKDHQLMD